MKCCKVGKKPDYSQELIEELCAILEYLRTLERQLKEEQHEVD